MLNRIIGYLVDRHINRELSRQLEDDLMQAFRPLDYTPIDVEEMPSFFENERQFNQAELEAIKRERDGLVAQREQLRLDIIELDAIIKIREYASDIFNNTNRVTGRNAVNAVHMEGGRHAIDDSSEVSPTEGEMAGAVRTEQADDTKESLSAA